MTHMSTSRCVKKKLDVLHGSVIYYNWVGSSAVEHPTVTRKTCVQLTTYPKGDRDRGDRDGLEPLNGWFDSSISHLGG